MMAVLVLVAFRMPAMMIVSLKETTAYQLITAWVAPRCVDVLLDGIGAGFNGVDPLLSRFRESLEKTRQKLQSSKDHLLVLGIDVVLREPLAEELDELRGWLSEIA
jgi:hypothetical protein